MQIYANPCMVYLGKCRANTWSFCKISASVTSWLPWLRFALRLRGLTAQIEMAMKPIRNFMCVRGVLWVMKFKEASILCFLRLLLIHFCLMLLLSLLLWQLPFRICTLCSSPQEYCEMRKWCTAKWEQSKWILLEWKLKNGCYGFPKAPFHPCNSHLHFSSSKHVVSTAPGVYFS